MYIPIYMYMNVTHIYESFMYTLYIYSCIYLYVYIERYMPRICIYTKIYISVLHVPFFPVQLDGLLLMTIKYSCICPHLNFDRF